MQYLVREGCHLCVDAEPGVRAAVRWAGGTVELVDIETSDELVREYGVRIPVVRVRGTDVAEGTIDPIRLWRDLVRIRLSRGCG